MVFERKDIDLCQICNLQLIYRDGLLDLAVNSSTTWMLPDMDQEKPASDVVASAAVSAS
jgi:hypothetical protein